MAKIKILPEILSNKIAAGEVVERPASVAKELIENAIDAKSTRIILEIENGGRDLIQVADNGVGMAHDDALLSLERYATSKIHTDADLFGIRTLGFRGEALPSIASVSCLNMVTRDAASETGTAIQVEGGKIKQVAAVGAPVGTLISVRRLFFNVPARRKFLKSGETEMGHLAETVAAIALGCPQIQFRLLHNGKPVKNWPLTGDPLDRVAAVLGQEIRGDLRAIAGGTEAFSISGWISRPEVTRSSSQKIYLFVNGRYIRDRGLQHALFEGYGGRLMKGRFPVAVIFIHVPHDQLDVNVHPTKHEVRFSGYQAVYDLLKNAVLAAWSKAGPGPFQRPLPTVLAQPEAGLQKNREFPRPERAPDLAPAIASPPPHGAQPQTPTDQGPTFIAEALPGYESRPAETLFKAQATAPELLQPKPLSAAQQTLWEEEQGPAFRVIGQIHNTYIICESGEDLVLVDQHAAHERILFEQLKTAAEGKLPAVQNLLLPEMMDLGYKEAAILDQLLPELNRFGLVIEPFGGRTYAVKSAPALIADQAMGPLVQALIDRLADIGFTQGLEKILDECRILMACHGALRAHQRLSEKEMTALIRQLTRCENPAYCPHGRPVWIRWSKTALEKLFKRIV